MIPSWQLHIHPLLHSDDGVWPCPTCENLMPRLREALNRGPDQIPRPTSWAWRSHTMEETRSFLLAHGEVASWSNREWLKAWRLDLLLRREFFALLEEAKPDDIDTLTYVLAEYLAYKVVDSDLAMRACSFGVEWDKVRGLVGFAYWIRILGDVMTDRWKKLE